MSVNTLQYTNLTLNNSFFVLNLYLLNLKMNRWPSFVSTTRWRACQNAQILRSDWLTQSVLAGKRSRALVTPGGRNLN